MSQWTGTAQAWIAAGNAVTIIPAAHVTARRFSDGVSEGVGFHKGAEILNLSIEGGPRTYVPAGDALEIDGLEISAGLLVKGQRVTISGINETVDALQKVYDLNNAPVDVVDLAFTPGLSFLGYRVLFKGFVDGTPLSLDDTSGEYSIIAVSRIRKGTRKLDALLDETRDPIFKYVGALEGDAWG